MYAKLINGILEYPPKIKDGISNYDLYTEKLIEDGYKELIESEKPTEYCEAYYTQSKTKIFQRWRDITPQVLEERKNEKLEENTNKAYQAIKEGYVIYKEAQFETNTDTTDNLDNKREICIVRGDSSAMWLSKDDQYVELQINTEVPLEDDFIKIGFLIEGFKDKVWGQYYMGYKQQILEATTVEEVDNIMINYPLCLTPEEVTENNDEQ